MERKDLEELRAKVSCGAVLETSGWKIDSKESSRRAVKYRRGEREIVIVTHGGKGWFDPMSDAKGDVFSLSTHLNGSDFVEALEQVSELVGFVPCQPVWRKPFRDKTVSIRHNAMECQTLHQTQFSDMALSQRGPLYPLRSSPPSHCPRLHPRRPVWQSMGGAQRPN